MIKKLLIFGALAFVGPLSGCVWIAAGTVGGVIADEGLNENDGKFDPFENTEVGRAIYN